MGSSAALLVEPSFCYTSACATLLVPASLLWPGLPVLDFTQSVWAISLIGCIGPASPSQLPAIPALLWYGIVIPHAHNGWLAHSPASHVHGRHANLQAHR